MAAAPIHHVRVCGSFVATELNLTIHTAREVHASVKQCQLNLEKSTYDNDLFTWYFNSYAVESPFQQTKADQATQALRQCGKALWNGLCLRKIFAPENHEGKQIIILEVQGYQDDFSIHEVPWEILEDEATDASFEIHVVRGVAGLEPRLESRPIARNRAPFRLLLIVARSLNDFGDINSRLISEDLLDIIEAVRRHRQVTIDFVRPGSFNALQAQLKAARSCKKRYDAVHFDLHGNLSNEDNDNAPETYLGFLSHTQPFGEMDYRPAREVALLLKKYRVQSVVSNACKSATTGTRVATNLARACVEIGIPRVLACSYDMNMNAAKIFMRTFYDSFIANEASFVSSVSQARSRLRTNRERSARFGKTIEVDDWIVPVVYVHADIPIDLQRDNSERTVSEPGYTINPDQQLIGRDYDIYRLEAELILLPSHILQITGFSGAGKSSLLQHLCVWWKRSCLIEDHFYADCGENEAVLVSLNSIVAKHGALLPAMDTISSPDYTATSNPNRPSAPSIEVMLKAAEAMRNRNLLLVFDSLESMSQQNLASLKMFLQHLTSKAKPMRSFLILSSCHSIEEPLNLSSLPRLITQYTLSGLSSDDCLRICNYGSRISQEKVALEYLERICRLLCALPGAIMAIRDVLRGGETNVKETFYDLLFGKVSFSTLSLLTMPRIRMGIEACRSWSSEHQQLLGFLAPFFWKVPREYAYYLGATGYTKFGIEPSAAMLENLKHKFRHILATLKNFGLVETLVDIGERDYSPSTNAGPTDLAWGYLAIHPIFTLFLRSELPIIRPAIDIAPGKSISPRDSFLSLYLARSKALSTQPKRYFDNVRFDYYNHVRAIALTLVGEFPPRFDEIETLACLPILCSAAARRSCDTEVLLHVTDRLMRRYTLLKICESGLERDSDLVRSSASSSREATLIREISALQKAKSELTGPIITQIAAGVSVFYCDFYASQYDWQGLQSSLGTARSINQELQTILSTLTQDEKQETDDEQLIDHSYHLQSLEAYCAFGRGDFAECANMTRQNIVALEEEASGSLKPSRRAFELMLNYAMLSEASRNAACKSSVEPSSVNALDKANALWSQVFMLSEQEQGNASYAEEFGSLRALLDVTEALRQKSPSEVAELQTTAGKAQPFIAKAVLYLNNPETYDEAIRALLDGMELCHKHPAAKLKILGILQGLACQKDAWKDARQYLHNMLSIIQALEPDHLLNKVISRDEVALAHFHYGVCSVELGEIDRGLAHVIKALEAIKDFPGRSHYELNWWRYLRRLARRLGLREEAQQASLHSMRRACNAFALLMDVADERRLGEGPRSLYLRWAAGLDRLGASGRPLLHDGSDFEDFLVDATLSDLSDPGVIALHDDAVKRLAEEIHASEATTRDFMMKIVQDCHELDETQRKTLLKDMCPIGLPRGEDVETKLNAYVSRQSTAGIMSENAILHTLLSSIAATPRGSPCP